MKRLITLATLSLFAAGAHAAGEFGHLDITFVQPDVEQFASDGMGTSVALDGDGDGIGVEFVTGFLGNSFFSVEHTARNIDSGTITVTTPTDQFSGTPNSDYKNTEFGLGYGYPLGESGALTPYGAVNLYEFEVDGDSDDGYSLVVGAEFALNDRIGLGARYKLFKSNDDETDDDLSGFRVSGSYALTPVFGFVLRFESLSADGDNGGELDITDIHLGFRAIFGGGDDN